METYIPEMTVPGILGFLAPLFIAAVNQPRFSATVRRIIAIVASVVIALVALFVTGSLSFDTADPVGIFTVIFAVIGVAQLAYAVLWKPTGVVAKVEEITTVSPEHRAE